MSALASLIAEGQKYPKPDGSRGFVITLRELLPILSELTPLVPVGIHTVEDDGDFISFEVRIGFTIGRSEVTS